MWKALRKVGLALVVLIISAGIFLLIVKDRTVKQDVLGYSLGLLGDKLLAMVPEGAEKQSLKELYQRFTRQAVAKKVAPEQIEKVAANILNVSNMDTTLTPQQAEVVLHLALIAPVEMKPEGEDTVKSKKGKRISQPPTVPHKPIASGEWESLGERLKSMYEFNAKVMKENATQQRELQRYMQYRAEDGLKLALDAGLKHKLNQREYRRLAKELKRLEREHRLVWRENFAEELRKQTEQMQKELQSLQELKHWHRLEELKGLPGLEALKALEPLKSLEALKYVPVIDADSIRKIIEESLKEAGIDSQKQE